MCAGKANKQQPHDVTDTYIELRGIFHSFYTYP